jgi:hypothetical protein
LSTADLRVADATASRLHARFEVGADGAMFVSDTGGAGGVRVNGELTERCEIRIGDKVAFGRSEFTFLRVEEADDPGFSAAQYAEVFEASTEMRAVEKESARRLAARGSAPAHETRAMDEAVPETTATSIESPVAEERLLVEPESEPSPGAAALEVGLLYQGNRIELAHFQDGAVRVGAELEIPVEGTRYEGRTLFDRGPRGWVVIVPNGEIWRPEHGGGKVTKPDLVPGFFREGDSIGAPIGVRDRGSFTVGPLQLDYRLVPPVRPWPTSW